MKTKAWALTLALTLSVLSMPQKVWTQSVATDITVNKILPDSVSENVYSIWIDKNGDILAAMSYRGLLRSTDDGKTWERIFKKDFLSNFGFGAIRDKKTNAILYGSGSGIFRSTDEGKSWTFVWSAGGGGCFLAKPDGSILGGMSYRITQSDDGGATWREIFYDPRPYFNVEELAMNPRTGSIFAGTADTIGLGILRSTDDGKTWQQSNGGLGDLHVWSVASDSNGTIYAGTENGLYRSVNDGVSWTRITEIGTSHRWARKILAVKPNLVFVGFDWKAGAAKSGVLKYDGKVWTQIVADTVYIVKSLAVKGKSLLVGTWNTIYRVDGAIDTPTAVDDYPSVPTAFMLSQNFPNPFNPSTSIEYQVSRMTYVKLAVYNILGVEVSVLVDKTERAGVYTATFDGSNLPSGIYFYQLKAGAFTETKRMVLVK
ncbi:MAG: T9SS type A sorting domain-containing protein [Candidatus Jorgensenbacteria bacterium]